MVKKTQTEILNEVLIELQEIKRGLPNGEIALMQKSLDDLEKGQKSLKSEIRTVQKRLFNPDSGVIVEVNIIISLILGRVICYLAHQRDTKD